MPGVLGGSRHTPQRRIERIRVPPLFPEYDTLFPNDENPISEGGAWRMNDVLQTKVQTTGGSAYGTQDGTGAFDDSIALLSGLGQDYYLEAVIARAAIADGNIREVELWLRGQDDHALWDPGGGFGNTHMNGYEVQFAQDGAYSHVGRFKGDDLSAVFSWGPPQDGDIVWARIQGQHITAGWNEVTLHDFVDNDAVKKITTGDPGIGFFRGTGTNQTDYGFKSLNVTKL